MSFDEYGAPTPQTELDWAIHNDHADGNSPDVQDDDFEYEAAGRDTEYTDHWPDWEDPDDDGCTCQTWATPSGGGDGYGGNFTDVSGCPIHDPDELPDPPTEDRPRRTFDPAAYRDNF